jgi:hypothetical protein
MIGVPARIVQGVVGHELRDLQRALLAVDVRQLNVGFKRFLYRRSVREQAIGQHWHPHRIHDFG